MRALALALLAAALAGVAVAPPGGGAGQELAAALGAARDAALTAASDAVATGAPQVGGGASSGGGLAAAAGRVGDVLPPRPTAALDAAAAAAAAAVAAPPPPPPPPARPRTARKSATALAPSAVAGGPTFTLAQARAAAAACGARCPPPAPGPVLPVAPWASADLSAFDADGTPVSASASEAATEGGGGDGAPAPAPAPPLLNGGGRTLADGVALTLVFYGPDWPRATRSAVTRFARAVGGSPWLTAALAPYAAAPRVDALAPVTVADGADRCWRGSVLSPGAVAGVAGCAVGAGRAPLNVTRQLVVVLGDPGTDQTSAGGGAGGEPAGADAPAPPPPSLGSLCVDHCGWHATARAGGDDAARVAAAFVGAPARCPAACAPQWPAAPGGDPAAAALVNALASILVGAATDAEGGAWHDADGRDAGGRCAWRFGEALRPAPGGGVANAEVGGEAVLVQSVWSPTAGACV